MLPLLSPLTALHAVLCSLLALQTLRSQSRSKDKQLKKQHTLIQIFHSPFFWLLLLHFFYPSCLSRYPSASPSASKATDNAKPQGKQSQPIPWNDALHCWERFLCCFKSCFVLILFCDVFEEITLYHRLWSGRVCVDLFCFVLILTWSSKVWSVCCFCFVCVCVCVVFVFVFDPSLTSLSKMSTSGQTWDSTRLPPPGFHRSGTVEW